MKKQLLMISICAVLSFILTGCSGHSDDKTEAAHHSSETTGSEGEETENTGEETTGNALGIPSQADIEIPVGDTGMKSIRITDDSIEIPDTDVWYTQEYVKEYFTPDRRKELLELCLDEEDGIYIYDDSSNEEIAYSYKESLFERDKEALTYEEEDYVGKINGKIYSMAVSNNEDAPYSVPYIWLYAEADELLDDRTQENTVMATTGVDGDEYSEENNPLKKKYADIAEEAQNYFEKMGYMAETDIIYNMYTIYLDEEDNELERILDGAYAELYPSLNGQEIYRLDVSLMDEVPPDSDMVPDTATTIEYSVNSQGLNGMTIYNVMKNVGEPKKVDNILTWDEAIEVAKTEIPKQYEEKKSKYRAITFNEVKFTYFKIWTDESGDNFKIIPVYLFETIPEKQSVEEPDGLVYTLDRPTNLFIIDATNGKTVQLIQNSGGGFIER